MIANDLQTRLKLHWAKWKHERRWRKSTPAQQAVYLVEMLHQSPELRRMFRDALFGKTTEARNPTKELERSARRAFK